MKTIDFIFDFASPNAYFANVVLKQIAERCDANIHYIPCLLGGIFKDTNNQAPMVAFGQIKGKLEYDSLETQRFIQKHNIKNFTMNENFPINTLLLGRGAIFAQREGFFLDYLEAGLKHIWELNKKMDDQEIFVSAMNESGFDGQAILEGTKTPEVKAQLIKNTQAAVERNVFGIPTFFVGDEMFFGKERLSQIEELLQTL